MISVCILAKNSAASIEATLESVRSFPEVILLDNGSEDGTVTLAQKYPNVKIFHSPFQGFGPMRNLAASFAANDWILALDTDEAISPSLLQEMASLPLDPKTVYSMPRDNFYNGKKIKGCGWHPDRVVRLYHRRQTQYSPVSVHESVESKGCRLHLCRAPLLHTPFRSTAEFLAKMQHYSHLFANQYAKKRSSSLRKAFFHSLFAFFRSYFFQRGFLLGAEGFIVSLYNSNMTFYKYLKLWEENQKNLSE